MRTPEYSFSRAFVHPSSSPIRELFKYLDDPEMISFAGGYPAAELFDVEGLGEASARAYRSSLSCLQYGTTDGIAPIKAEIVRLMDRRGIQTVPEDIVVTTGSQQAFDLLLRVMVNEGDVVLVESPTYTNNIQAVRVSGARIVAIPTDAQGLDVDALERVLSGATNAPDRPKLLYTVPTFGNPNGSTMSLQRRLRLLELAVRHRFVVAEDDPYGDLRFSGEPMPSLRSLTGEVEGSADWVVHMASLSKIVAPGLRVAWSVAPRAIAHRCYVAKQSADVGSSPWTQRIAAEYLASGRLDAHLARIRKEYSAKCRALCAALRGLMPGALSFHEPDGGMFVWAELSEHVDASDLLKAALDRKVMFVPGAGFYPDIPNPGTLRLSFAAATVPGIQEGVRRLSGAWDVVRGRR